MFSIIIPFLNTDFKILSRAIDSIVNSSRINKNIDYEIVLIDDGSELNYKNNIDSYYSDIHIKYLRIPINRGRSFARNLGIKNSKFNYILFLDSDDIVLPNYFYELQKYNFLMNDNIKYLTFSYQLNKLNVYRIISPFTNDNVSHKRYNFFCTNSIMIHKSVFNKFLFDEFLDYGEDLKLWGQIALNFNGMHINIPITRYFFDYKTYKNSNQFKELFKLLKIVKYYFKFEVLGWLLKSKLITEI
jgi:glycosyltransferase involved in cell wall biosynthesis